MGAAAQPYLALLVSTLLLVIVQRNFHRRLQAVLLLLLREQGLAFACYALLFLPGVAIHETSHWLVARLLGVRVRAFSLWPRRKEGGLLRMGYVEMDRHDWFRGAMIGGAPLVVGAAILGVMAFGYFDLAGALDALTRGDWTPLLAQYRAAIETPNLWLWVYLALAISNTMLPSSADRHAWLPVAALSALLVAVVAVLGYGATAGQIAQPVLSGVAQALTAVFGFTIALDLLMLPLLWAIEKSLGWLTGLEVVS